MDARCLGVGLAIINFCSSWKDLSDRDLLLDRVELFLGSYQETSEKMSALGLLSKLRLECLPQMVLAGCLYVLDWTLGEYYASHPDALEFLRYTQHSVRLVR